MDKNEELQKKARNGQMAIKGTIEPDVTSEPVAPAAPYKPFSGDHAVAVDPDGKMRDPLERKVKE